LELSGTSAANAEENAEETGYYNNCNSCNKYKYKKKNCGCSKKYCKYEKSDLIAQGAYEKIWASSYLNDYSLPTPPNIIVGSTTTGAATSTIGAWKSAADNSTNPYEYLIVEFEKGQDIYGVATQGRPDAAGVIQDDHIIKYCLIYNDGTGWFTTDDGGDSWDYPYDITNPDDCYEFDGDELASDE
jgi:hypothetical protein